MGMFANLKYVLAGNSQESEYQLTPDGRLVPRSAAAIAEVNEHASMKATLAALSKTQAIIEFSPAGEVLTANEKFLSLFGYKLDEIKGRNESMFLPPQDSITQGYRDFWSRLNQGQAQTGDYRRISKNGNEIWIKASYTPVIDDSGNVSRIIKFATDFTEQKIRNAERAGQLAAIDKVMATIEFKLDGTILTANDNFLKTVGYSLKEIQGKHQSMFVDASYRNSREYSEFWAKLNRGEFHAGEFKRMSKNGKEVWINASYNPILGPDGKVYKVVKYAIDITAQKLRDADNAGQLAAINKSQAVIEFRMDGTIVHANQNFLHAVGYSLAEIQGKHHSMLVDPAYRSSRDYSEFWARLNRGEYDAGEYLHLGKGGKQIWIQASYNPILDTEGRPCKVVKYASDITAQKQLQLNVNHVMTDITRVMNSLAQGKLTDHMNNTYTGEFAQLANSINSYINRLTDMVQQIQQAANQVKNGAREIASGNTNLSQRTEDQAATLEETSAAMEEMTTTVQQNAANASQANQRARSARDAAEEGGKIVGSAIKAMEAISEASNRINDIIGVIDEIAFQTNLLALNAAVEAARAGDQGRGFAVVADEVRNLAGRSATAAKEIKGLIKDSNEKVKEGSVLVNNSGKTLQEIVSAVKTVNDIISEIATASDEQATGLNEVGRAVSSMDETTQQNAALVEQAAAASEALGQQAEALEELITFFDLGQHHKIKH